MSTTAMKLAQYVAPEKKTHETKLVTRLKIHYKGWDSKWDVWCNVENELNRFAKLGSVTSRKPQRFLNLKTNEPIDINPTMKHPGFKRGTIKNINAKTGAIKVTYSYQTTSHVYWTHLDNSSELRAAQLQTNEYTQDYTFEHRDIQMSLKEVQSLSIGDKIDHRDTDGRFLVAKIVDKTQEEIEIKGEPEFKPQMEPKVQIVVQAPPKQLLQAEVEAIERNNKAYSEPTNSTQVPRPSYRRQKSSCSCKRMFICAVVVVALIFLILALALDILYIIGVVFGILFVLVLFFCCGETQHSAMDCDDCDCDDCDCDCD